jgi:hypothetical protein
MGIHLDPNLTPLNYLLACIERVPVREITRVMSIPRTFVVIFVFSGQFFKCLALGFGDKQRGKNSHKPNGETQRDVGYT